MAGKKALKGTEFGDIDLDVEGVTRAEDYRDNRSDNLLKAAQPTAAGKGREVAPLNQGYLDGEIEAPLPDAPDDIAAAIHTAWDAVSEQYLKIGRLLIKAKTLLTAHGEYQQWVEERLSFRYQVAHKIRAVAEAFQEGIFGPETLPRSYSTAYEIVSLKPEARDALQSRGLIRRDVTREAVLEFKRDWGRDLPALPSLKDNRKALTKRLESLREKRAKLDAEIADIERQLESEE